MRRSATVAPLPAPGDNAIEYASLFVHATLSVPVAVSLLLRIPAVPKLMLEAAIVQSLITVALTVNCNVAAGVDRPEQESAVAKYCW